MSCFTWRYCKAASVAEWKEAINTAESEEAVKFDLFKEILPSRAQGYRTAPRALSTDFIRKYQDKESVTRDAEKVRAELMPFLVKSAKAIDLYVPFTGQTTGLIRDILPASEIVKRTVSEARAILDRAGTIGK